MLAGQLRLSPSTRYRQSRSKECIAGSVSSSPKPTGGDSQQRGVAVIHVKLPGPSSRAHPCEKVHSTDAKRNFPDASEPRLVFVAGRLLVSRRGVRPGAGARNSFGYEVPVSGRAANHGDGIAGAETCRIEAFAEKNRADASHQYQLHRFSTNRRDSASQHDLLGAPRSTTGPSELCGSRGCHARDEDSSSDHLSYLYSLSTITVSEPDRQGTEHTSNSVREEAGTVHFQAMRWG